MRYAAGFSRASITVKVLCLLRVNYILIYFKLFFRTSLASRTSRLSLASLALPCLPSRLSLASLAILYPWRESKDFVRSSSSPGLCAVLLSGAARLASCQAYE